MKKEYQKKDYQAPQIEVIYVDDIVTASGGDTIHGGGAGCEYTG